MSQPMRSLLSSAKKHLTRCLDVYATVRLYDDLSALPVRVQEDIHYTMLRQEAAESLANTLGPVYRELREKVRDRF